MLMLREYAFNVVLIDHHLKAQETIGDLFDIDMTKSGCVLAWEWFYPDTPVPLFLQYIQDRDLWKFELADSKAIIKSMDRYELSFSYINMFDFIFKNKNNLNSFINEGAIVLNHFNSLMKTAQKDVHFLNIGGYHVPAVNTHMAFRSDLSNKISEGHPFGAVYNIKNEEVRFSIRSKENGLNVNDVAKQYGGGGHEHAAGFIVTMATFATKMVIPGDYTGKLYTFIWDQSQEEMNKILDSLREDALSYVTLWIYIYGNKHIQMGMTSIEKKRLRIMRGFNRASYKMFDTDWKTDLEINKNEEDEIIELTINGKRAYRFGNASGFILQGIGD